MTKIIANYLPQFHVIPENSKWWGEGYTDWVGVRQAKPQYIGHNQPRIPLNRNYYSLDNIETLKWQAELANKYGVYGFGIYHYWFSSNFKLLEKPAEMLLSHSEIKIHYMFIWDNASWSRTWTRKGCDNDWAPQFDKKNYRSSESRLLAELKYGTETDWKIHFEYLLQFFRDERYIKLDGKPVFAFFQPRNDFELQKKMVTYWEKLAVESGLPGLICLSKDNARGNNFEYRFRYSPFSPNNLWGGIKNKINYILAKKRQKIRFADYDSHWKSILSDARRANDNTFLSGFVAFDDTPRRGRKARIIQGESPEKFGRYMKKLIQISQKKNKEYVFVTAWNEWGEGAYLEPDETNGYAYLEALKVAIDECQSEK